MRKHAPEADPVGVAMLANRRFVIAADGYASVVTKHAAAVYGVLWRLTRATASRLPAGRTSPPGSIAPRRCRCGTPAAAGWRSVYLARSRKARPAKADYMELVIAAALMWHLPPVYIASIKRWLPKRPRGAGARERGEFGWT